MTKKYGIPRTASEAKRRGYQPIDVDFSSMEASERSRWASIDTVGTRNGALSHVRWDIGPDPGNTNNNMVRQFCYYHDGQKPDCFQISADEADQIIAGKAPLPKSPNG